ncbi:MAG: 50S ribosomal protein L29 [Kiritimatiellales bacterium]
MKKLKQLKELSPAELEQQLGDAKKELFKLRMQQVSGQLENPLRIRTVRRQIARIRTSINQAVKGEG